jgi:hypothetical protein
MINNKAKSKTTKAKSKPIKKPVEIQTNNKKNSVVETKNKDLTKSEAISHIHLSLNIDFDYWYLRLSNTIFYLFAEFFKCRFSI